MMPGCAMRMRATAARVTSSIGSGQQSRYQFQLKPLGSQELDNKTVVSVEISGTFPGSPIALDYHFAIAYDKIASLFIDS